MCPVEDAFRQKKSAPHTSRSLSGGLHASLKEALVVGSGPTALLILHEEGRDLYEVLETKGEDWSRYGQVLVLLGDDRGITEAEVSAATALAGEYDVQVIQVSLGPAVLLSSHCIVIVHHLLDRFVHCCPSKHFDVAPEVSKSRKQRQSRLERRR